MNPRALFTATLFLCAVTASRFVAMAGLDPTLYREVLGAYLRSESRALIFLLQFVGVIYVLLKLINRPRVPVEKIGFMCAGFLMVSVARFFMPIFLVSLVGDLLVIGYVGRFHGKPVAGSAKDAL